MPAARVAMTAAATRTMAQARSAAWNPAVSAPLPAALTAGFQAALLACAIVLVAAAVIATRAAGTRQQLAAAQPAPGPETMAKAA